MPDLSFARKMSHLLRKSTKSVFFKSGFETMFFQRRKESAYKCSVQELESAMEGKLTSLFTAGSS